MVDESERARELQTYRLSASLATAISLRKHQEAGTSLAHETPSRTCHGPGFDFLWLRDLRRH